MKGLETVIGQLRDGQNTFRLKAPDKSCLTDMIEKPLRMAAFRDEAQIKDLPQHDGALALAQFALAQTWADRGADNQLLRAYDALNKVFGAPCTTAERFIKEKAKPEWHKRIIPIFMRLIQLGDTALRVTRRTAPLTEFSTEDRKMIAGFASQQGGRLLQTSHSHVEISHEGLITQWGRLHGAIQKNGNDTNPREV